MQKNVKSQNFTKYHKFKVIIKSSSGPRYVVGVKVKIDQSKLIIGARVALE